MAIAMLAAAVIAAGTTPARAGSGPADQPPSIVFGPLYEAVEEQSVFPDSKTFADALPDASPSRIMADYARAKATRGFSLGAFVAGHFRIPAVKAVSHGGRPNQGVQDYISQTWDSLRREPDRTDAYSSLLPLPYPYVF